VIPAPTTHLETPQRILVVDDEGIVLVALREILMREGYHVMTHSNPLQALEALKKEAFSVIITDQQMPILTGLEFLAQARQIQPDATRILITAVLNLDTVIDAINKGEIYRFVVKPWLREELLATLKSAVQRYELTCRTHILQASTLAMNAASPSFPERSNPFRPRSHFKPNAPSKSAKSSEKTSDSPHKSAKTLRQRRPSPTSDASPSREASCANTTKIPTNSPPKNDRNSNSIPCAARP
jgi:CheY-like chemotaxis protein